MKSKEPGFAPSQRWTDLRVLFATVVLSVAPASAFTSTATAQAIWGSFDGSRINYGDGPLTGSAHNTLRSIIEANDGDIGLPTASLTAEYLSGVDVFYTSPLSTSTGTLSGPEQTALQNWIADGGTLIVTADIFPLAAYESFTAAYGVTCSLERPRVP